MPVYNGQRTHRESCGAWDTSQCHVYILTLTTHVAVYSAPGLVFFRISFPANTIETNDSDTTAFATTTNCAPLIEPLDEKWPLSLKTP